MIRLDHKATETRRPQRMNDNLSRENEVSHKIIKGAIEVHRELGPGLLESIYEECVCKEFDLNKIKYNRQKEIPIVYKNIGLNQKYRIDLIVEDCVIVELKCVENILPVYQAQLLSYLKLTGLRLGLILNFNVNLMKNGIKRIIL